MEWWAWVTGFWGGFKSFMESNFSTALWGALAGAWGGAWAVQAIADRAKQRESLRREIAQTSKAIEFVLIHLTQILNVKEQFVLPMITQYDEVYRILHEYHDGLDAGVISQETPPPVLPAINLHSLGAQHIKMDRLESILFDELTLSGRPRALIGALSENSTKLDFQLKERDDMLQRIKAEVGGGLLKRVQFAFLFGLRQPGGVDQTFRSNTHAIAKTTDDTIHYLWLLYKDLRAHGLELRAAYRRKYRDPVQGISLIDLRIGEVDQLFPDASRYEDWETGFGKIVPSSYGRRLRMTHYWLRKHWKALKRLLPVRIVWEWLRKWAPRVLAPLLVVMVVAVVWALVDHAVIPAWRWMFGS